MKSLEIINKMSEKEAVKLESQLVELADFKADFTRYLSLAEKTEQNVLNINNSVGTENKRHRDEMVKLFKTAKSEVGVYKMMVSTVEKQLDILQKQAKELGLSVEQVPAYKIAQQILDKNKFKMIGAYDQKKEWTSL
jgi:hypothetical protein